MNRNGTRLLVEIPIICFPIVVIPESIAFPSTLILAAIPGVAPISKPLVAVIMPV